MLYEELLARAHRASIETEVTRASADARRLRKALRRARRRPEASETPPTVAKPAVVDAVPASPAPTPVVA